MDPEALLTPHPQDDKETNAGDLRDRSGNLTGSPAQGSRVTPIVDDFDGSANALWSLYGKEAESHDGATVQILMDAMGSVLTFAGLFSAVLASFLVDRYQNLRQSPTQQSAYYQQQSAVLLNQISHQLTSLGAQIPSDLSLPAPTFNASASDVRVNIFWFSSLVFSLSAALLATLFQRWTQDYMYIFQRYSSPLQIARIRQFLHEGARRWLMLPLSEVVPGLIHISLFLFLIGLADFLLSNYPLVGKVTIFSITFCAALYIFSTVAPFFDPKSPYHTSFSHGVWYLTRKLQKYWPKGLFGLSPRLLDANMAKGQMQLAMENNDARKDRDKRAIQWLVTKLTEDGEMESLASGIPGSFNPEWGVKVWKWHLRRKKRESTSSTVKVPSRLSQQGPRPASQSHNDAISASPPPSSHEDVVHDLCQRIEHLFVTCNHRDSFLNEDEWRQRLRACVETTASFVFCMDSDIESFGDIKMIGKLLSKLGSAEKTREVSVKSLNWSFITRWTCLSIVAIRKLLDSRGIREYASGPILSLGTSRGAGTFKPAETALENARKLDTQSVEAWGYMEELRREFIKLDEGGRTGGVEDILRDYNSKLEKINELAAFLKPVDASVSVFHQQIDHVTHDLIRQLPGVDFDEPEKPTRATPLGHVFDSLAVPAHPRLLHLSPRRLLALGALNPTRGSQGYVEMADVLKNKKTIPKPQHHLMEQVLWRLEDLSVGAFGFTLELYFLSLRQILSTSPSLPNLPKAIHILFYTSSFKAITSDWKEFKGKRGTLQIILNLVCDIALGDRGVFSNYKYPDYITKELLALFRNMIEEQESPYIAAAMKELKDDPRRNGDEEFREGAWDIFRAHKAASS